MTVAAAGRHCRPTPAAGPTQCAVKTCNYSIVMQTNKNTFFNKKSCKKYFKTFFFNFLLLLFTIYRKDKICRYFGVLIYVICSITKAVKHHIHNVKYFYIDSVTNSLLILIMYKSPKQHTITNGNMHNFLSNRQQCVAVWNNSKRSSSQKWRTTRVSVAAPPTPNTYNIPTMTFPLHQGRVVMSSQITNTQSSTYTP